MRNLKHREVVLLVGGSVGGNQRNCDQWDSRANTSSRANSLNLYKIYRSIQIITPNDTLGLFMSVHNIFKIEKHTA